MSRRALICAYAPPQADRDSGSRRIWDLMQVLLAEGWKLSFVAAQGIGEARYARPLQQRGISVHDGVGTSVEELLAAVRFDLAIFAFWPVAEFYLPIVRRVSPDTRVIVDSLDLHFLRDARRIFGEGTVLDDDYASQMSGEMNTYAAADAVMAVSQKEADLIGDIVGEPGLAHAVPDSESIDPSPLPFAPRRGLVMVGCFQHPPNVQAVAHLCREILPRVPKSLLAEHPVYIVGHGLDDATRAFAKGLPNVRMTGWVPSVTPYLREARISVVPLLYGAGTKRKMLQALTTGTPAVTTSIGAEGLNLRDGEHALIIDEPARFADGIVRLLTDQALWLRLQKNGRAHVAGTHGPERARARFLEVIKRTLRREPKAALLAEGGLSRFQQRMNYQYFQQFMPAIRDLVAGAVPAGAKIAVVTAGDAQVLKIERRECWHFYQDDQARPIEGHPADALEAINRLEDLRIKGAEYLLIPRPSLWWLEHWTEFREHLDLRYKAIEHLRDICALYELHAGKAEAGKSKIPDASADGSEPPRGEGDAAHDVRAIAFYLPQFHPIPENDAWWGEGFTEWRNVVKAQPLFPGHDQPQLPADLGYYDLRAAETREAQATLARRYGISGFCYYHYWFSGKRLLERPFNEVLASGEPDFPFCLCWANEPWSRQWDGRPTDVLQPQPYSEQDDLEHIHWLIPALSDPRAIKVRGKPLFLVYQGRELPAAERTIETWRREAERAGLPGLHLVAVESGWDAGWDATQVGFDAKVLFQPQFSLLRTTPRTEIAGMPDLQVFDYQKAWPLLANPEPVPYPRYETVFPAWDNTARKGERGWVVHDSSPAAYEEWLRLAVRRAAKMPAGERLVFLNAWNEWAEGAHLEPDAKHGHDYLEATRRALLARPAAEATRPARRRHAAKRAR